MSNILNGLNNEQKEAVTYIDGPLQIIAGAGSGKTLVLTRRIAYMLEQNISPYNILALTFTNKAANEMKSRISNFIDLTKTNNLWVGTFHSIFARILRIEAHEIGYERNFSIYDEEDSAKVVKQINDSINVKNSQVQPKVIYSIISSLKNKFISPETYARTASTLNEKYISEVYNLYKTEFKKNNAMDFDDLLLNMIDLFNIEQVLSKYQDRFKYILVDEYQDTNHVQYLVIKKLAERYKNICIVGDDAQSIYKWRGADIHNILNFKNDYPKCHTIKLEQNYRSTSNILNAADSVISNNKEQLKKKLWTNSAGGERVKLMKFNNEKDEANQIINIIKEQYHKGKSLNDFAILYRTNAQSLQFEKACRSNNLPYVVVGSTSFYKRKEVKDILAYLQILVNPKDKVSLYRIINEPHRGIGPITINKIIEIYKKNPNYTIIDALTDDDINNLQMRNNAKIELEKFINNIKETIKKLDENNSPIENIIIDYLDKMGIIKHYKEIDELEGQNKIDNINQLLEDIFNFLRDNPEKSLSDYLEQITLISDLDTKGKDIEEKNIITLMTLHSSKGLEFDTVFIPGIESNLFPLERETLNSTNIEEERRLFYVGITRAKKNLYLSYVHLRIYFGKTKEATPSIFLKEINTNVLEDITKNTFLTPKRNFETILPTTKKRQIQKRSNIYNPKTKFPIFDDFNNYCYSQIPPDYTKFKLGDMVKHSKFGKGKIISIIGEGKNKKAIILFALYGHKQLLLEYAKLEKI